MVRDLKDVLEREKAEVFLFVTLEEPSRPMHLEATTAGVYQSELSGRDYPRIQIESEQDPRRSPRTSGRDRRSRSRHPSRHRCPGRSGGVGVHRSFREGPDWPARRRRRMDFRLGAKPYVDLALRTQEAYCLRRPPVSVPLR